jgi:hypothetical protein
MIKTTVCAMALSVLAMGCGMAQDDAQVAENQDAVLVPGVLPIRPGGVPGGHVVPNVVGTFHGTGFGTLTLAGDKTYTLTHSCSDDNQPCHHITVQHGTYRVVSTIDPLFIQALVLTDEFGQTTSYNFSLSGMVLSLRLGDEVFALNKIFTNN